MPLPDGNIVDILSMLFAILAVTHRWIREVFFSNQEDSQRQSFEAKIAANAACAASLPPYLWMMGAVGWQSMLPTLLEASKLSLGLAGLTSLAFAFRELSN